MGGKHPILILRYGSAGHPEQWLTAVCFHQSRSHLGLGDGQAALDVLAALQKEDVTGIYTLRGKAEALQHLGRHGEADDRLKLIPEGRQ
ncbi:hypothetical protein D3OALGA1CA_5033 [Olavius algarvensis associated proteobacterium Delta 3]|nr:hypothetical protein D3OALGA1CA_5033 [Olavius algarvensis associated proteobacterium Delta 3]